MNKSKNINKFNHRLFRITIYYGKNSIDDVVNVEIFNDEDMSKDYSDDDRLSVLIAKKVEGKSDEIYLEAK
jgi:hypothetical protein